MSNLKGISLVMIFITVFTLFTFASNQMFPEFTQIDSTTNEEYETVTESWNAFGILNPFGFIHYFYDIMTFKVFGVSDDLQTLLQIGVYVPLAAITILCVLYFVRGN